MTYLVNPLPNSLLNYIFYFKSLKDDDVKKYIESIIDGDELFKKEDNNFREKVNEAIFYSHSFVREKNDKSSVSLRDLQRFRLAYRFFDKYFKYKIKFQNNNNKEIKEIDEKSKVRAIALSLFITYSIRIIKGDEYIEYVGKINPKLRDLSKFFKIQNWEQNDNDIKNQGENSQITFENNSFLYIVNGEQKFITDQMELNKVKGLGINNSLKQNIFLMFFSIYAHIPLIIVGKPGCSKSLSIQLIIRFMRGSYSNSNFLKNYPSINNTNFQGSETNTPESIEKIFKIAEEKLMDKADEMISLLVFDELGLSEKSPTNCLKVLHSKLEISLNTKDENKISFIGISNWRLDAAKMNRTIFLAIPEIGIDDIQLTSEAIAKSYNIKLYDNYRKEFMFLENVFYFYKEQLNAQNGLNEFDKNYHGGRDFYHIIKNFSYEMIKNNYPIDDNSKKRAINYSLARNLNGLEINGENQLKIFLEGLKNNEKLDEDYRNTIKLDEVNEIDLIIDNITSKDCRFLLLISEKSMFDFLVNIIKKRLNDLNEHAEDKKQYNYVNYIGSPFKGDMFNISYQTQMISSIENSVAKGKIIILSNLEQIYSVFYDLFNQNYIEKDKKKYCRVSHGGNIQKLAYVDDNTKFIILVDDNDIKKQKLPFLSRFEKLIIKFENILKKDDKEKSEQIYNLLGKLVDIEEYKYYDLDSLLINTNKNIINGYVSLYQGNENSYDDDIIMEKKIIPILPQDIIFALPFSKLSKEENGSIIIEDLKQKYLDKSYKSLDEYINSPNRGSEEILMVYTFSKIEDAINFSKKEIKGEYLEAIVSEINTANKFEHILKEFYEKKSILVLKFNSENTMYINFFISEINQYKMSNNIHGKDKKFIFIINIKRYFNLDNNKKNKKITTALIVDDNINQLFIDNLNGSLLSFADIEGKNMSDFIENSNLFDQKKYINEGMLNFYEKHINEQMGKYKGICYDNFKKEFFNFIEKNEKMIADIKKIISKHLGNSEKLVNLIFKNKFIDQNTIDFTSAIITYIKDIFNKKLEFVLSESESNNFFVTYFMLNYKEKEESKIVNDSSNLDLSYYSFNIEDDQLINNQIFNGIKAKYLKYLSNLKEDAVNNNSKIEIKVYYKIPAFFNVYKNIKSYLQNEKISRIYEKDERELRKCEFKFEYESKKKLKDDKEKFESQLLTELASNELVSEILKENYEYDNYIQFIETFLNDYITYYLVEMYKNDSKLFQINDVPHRIILILLDLKFRELENKTEDKKENHNENKDNQQNKHFKNFISKILWLEANTEYIKLILDLFNGISENILFDEKDNNILLKEIIKQIKENKIKYEPKEDKLLEVNTPFYIFIIILINCILDNKSIAIASLKNDNYNFYFRHLEKYLKEIQTLDKILKLDIKEISILNEFLIIYSEFERLGKLEFFDINELISIIIGNLEILKKKDENKIKELCTNLKNLIKYLENTLYDKTKEEELKGDENYYKLISDIFLSEIQRENSEEFKLFILKEFYLEIKRVDDGVKKEKLFKEKLFIQSLKLLIKILEDYVSPDSGYFQGSFEKLSDSKLELLENKMKNSDWINETILYIFEQISIIYIQNSMYDNEKIKEEKNRKNIIYDLKFFFEKCSKYLENLYEDPELKNETEDENKLNKHIKKVFSVSFIRVYLKIFIDKIEELEKDQIKEIIKVINERKPALRDILSFFIYKIIYNINGKNIQKLFNEEIIDTYFLKDYKNYFKIEEEKKLQVSPKFPVFIEFYNSKDEDLQLFLEIFKLLNDSENNKNNKKLGEWMENKKRIDIFYSAFSCKISAHLLNNIEENDDKIKNLKNNIENISSKDHFLKIINLFLFPEKNENIINCNNAEILQYCLKFCINADKIADDDNNIYSPIYNCEINNNIYFPGNDIKDKKLYDDYRKIIEKLDENYGVYVCTCNIFNADNHIYIEYIKGNGYPKDKGKCENCHKDVGFDKEKGFIQRSNYYRLFKNKIETNKNNDKQCMTIDKFFEKFILKNLDKDSRGLNNSSKNHFDKLNKPIRNQSQLGYRLMNLILYSHLFTYSLSTTKNEKTSSGFSYLDYIIFNWEKIRDILNRMNINIFIFMNLISKDLLNYLDKQKQIENYEELIKVENDIEKIINDKIERNQAKNSKYVLYASSLNKIINKFREDKENEISITSLIKEIKDPKDYEEEKYPYYKYFIYSDYPTESFLKMKLINKERYPTIDFYLNEEERKKASNHYKNFLCFNYVIKSLLNEYSYNITEEDAAKTILMDTKFFELNSEICEAFIKLINEKNKNKNKKLTKQDTLNNYLLNGASTLFKEMYNDFMQFQNKLLENIVKKINSESIDKLELQKIDIQEAKKEDLINFEFEKKSKFTEILLSNTYRDFYNKNSKIKYNNYNLYTIDFDNIEKIFEETFIKNACILKMDNIIEIIYKGEDYLNDGITDFKNNQNNLKDLDEKDEKSLISFYEDVLKTDLSLCLKINKELKDLIKYINKNPRKINLSNSLNDIINKRDFPFEFDEKLKTFLEANDNIIGNKISNFILYLEKLYFELAMEINKDSYNTKLDDETKNKIIEYNKNKNGQLLTEEKLSVIIIRFLLNIEMEKVDNKNLSIKENNLFDSISKKYLWEKEIYINNEKFNEEIMEYKKFNIYVKNAYDFYCSISSKSKKNFENRKNEMLDKIIYEKNKESEAKNQKDNEENEKKILEKKDDPTIQDFNIQDDFEIDEDQDF